MDKRKEVSLEIKNLIINEYKKGTSYRGKRNITRDRWKINQDVDVQRSYLEEIYALL